MKNYEQPKCEIYLLGSDILVTSGEKKEGENFEVDFFTFDSKFGD